MDLQLAAQAVPLGHRQAWPLRRVGRWWDQKVLIRSLVTVGSGRWHGRRGDLVMSERCSTRAAQEVFGFTYLSFCQPRPKPNSESLCVIANPPPCKFYRSQPTSSVPLCTVHCHPAAQRSSMALSRLPKICLPSTLHPGLPDCAAMLRWYMPAHVATEREAQDHLIDHDGFRCAPRTDVTSLANQSGIQLPVFRVFTRLAEPSCASWTRPLVTAAIERASHTNTRLV